MSLILDWRKIFSNYLILTNARYKFAIGLIRKSQQTMKADCMAQRLLSNNGIDFWKEVKSSSHL